MHKCRVLLCCWKTVFAITSSLRKTLLAFALLHFVLQGQTCLLLQVSLDFLLLHSNPIRWIGHLFFGIISRKCCRSHKNSQLQLFKHQWLEHKLGLQWYWIIYLGNKPRSFCHFWGCTQVLHFRLFSWLWGLLCFFQGILVHSNMYISHLIYIL